MEPFEREDWILGMGLNFDLSQSASFSQSTPQSSQQSVAESALGEDDSQSSFLASQEATPTTSFTQAVEPAFKKPRNQRAGGQGAFRCTPVVDHI